MQAKKDGLDHESVRRAVKRAWTRTYPNGATPQEQSCDLDLSEVGSRGERRELKHLSTSRKRNQVEIPLVAASEPGEV